MIRGIYTSASGMTSQIKKQETIADNLANVNTSAFKKSTTVMEQGKEFEIFRQEAQVDKKDLKKKSKLTAVGSAVPYEFPLVAGSSDYVEFMGNSRTSHFWIKGNYLGKSQFSLDMTLNFIEGPSCASVLIDVIRAVKLAKDKKIVGGPKEICSYAF